MAFALTPNNLTFANLEFIFREKPLLEVPPMVQETAPAGTEKSQMAQVYLQAHAVSFGPAVAEEIIRLALVLQQYVFVWNKGFQLAPVVLQRLLAFYNREVFPVVQQQGSPTSQIAQLCLPLVGQGKVSFQGYELNAADVNDIFSWEPLALSPTEVDILIKTPVFTYAETALNIIKLQPQLSWLDYLINLFTEIASIGEEPPANTRNLAAAVAKVKNLVEENVVLPADPDQQNLRLLRDALMSLLTEINHLGGALADYTTETLDNLFSSTEPPATNTFTLAAALVQSLQKQMALLVTNPAEVIFTRANINIVNQLLSKAIVYGEQLLALAFWSVAQVGKVFNFTPGNLTLSTYYHSSLYVPKEMVMEQLAKAITFIQSTSPSPVT